MYRYELIYAYCVVNFYVAYFLPLASAILAVVTFVDIYISLHADEPIQHAFIRDLMYGLHIIQLLRQSPHRSQNLESKSAKNLAFSFPLPSSSLTHLGLLARFQPREYRGYTSALGISNSTDTITRKACDQSRSSLSTHHQPQLQVRWQ